MATSGTTLWSQTCDELVTASLRKLTVLAEGESASSNQLLTGRTALNGLISSFQSLGMFLWKREEYEMTFVSGQEEYVFGSGLDIDIPAPVRLYQAIVNYGGGSQVDMELVPHYNYNLLTKNTQGMPVKGSYQYKNNDGHLFVWPIPDASAAATTTLILTYQKPFDMFTAGTETADFTQEWYLPLVYGLADLLSDEYGLPLEDRMRISKQADKFVSVALSASSEDTSTFFYPAKE